MHSCFFMCILTTFPWQLLVAVMLKTQPLRDIYNYTCHLLKFITQGFQNKQATAWVQLATSMHVVTFPAHHSNQLTTSKLNLSQLPTLSFADTILKFLLLARQYKIYSYDNFHCFGEVTKRSCKMAVRTEMMELTIHQLHVWTPKARSVTESSLIGCWQPCSRTFYMLVLSTRNTCREHMSGLTAQEECQCFSFLCFWATL